MAEQMLDVILELDPAALAAERNPTRTVIEIARGEAIRLCTEAGATLRHAEPVHFTSRSAVEAVSGKPVVLVSSRWLADGRR